MAAFRLRRKVIDVLALLGFGAVVTGGSIVLVLIAVGIALGLFALMTALWAVILWAAWNWTAPLFDFIPANYKHLDFLMVWGAVVVVRLIRSILFGRIKKDDK